MPDLYSFYVTANAERLHDEVERVGIVAYDEADAIRMVTEQHGEGVGWTAAPAFEEPCDNPDFTQGHVVFVETAPARNPEMTANQLYAVAEPLERIYDPWRFRHYLDFDDDRIPEESNKRVSYRVISDICEDGERCHTLGTLWLDDKPFMVTQSAGRGGMDFLDEHVTDPVLYKEALAYLRSLYKPEPDLGLYCIDPDTPLRELTFFYGDSADIPGVEKR